MSHKQYSKVLLLHVTKDSYINRDSNPPDLKFLNFFI